MNRWLGLCLLGMLPIILGSPSCAPTRSGIALDTTAINAFDLLQKMRETSAKVGTLEGKGTITFESPELGGSAAFELSLKKPDSLLVLFEGPFGIDVGTLFLSRERYVVYSSLENVVITGVPRTSTIRSVIPFDLTYDQILNAFSGTFDIPDDVTSVRSFGIDDDQFLIRVDSGSKAWLYWIDSRHVQVTRFEVRDRSDHLLMQATTAAFAEESDAFAPKRIVIWFPQEQRQISVHYSTLTINPPNPSFVYSVPLDARTLTR
jgi:hypothetical protein